MALGVHRGLSPLPSGPDSPVAPPVALRLSGRPTAYLLPQDVNTLGTSTPMAARPMPTFSQNPLRRCGERASVVAKVHRLFSGVSEPQALGHQASSALRLACPAGLTLLVRQLGE